MRSRRRLRIGTVGLLWRITFVQTVLVFVAGAAVDVSTAAIVAVVFLVSNMAILAWVDPKGRE